MTTCMNTNTPSTSRVQPSESRQRTTQPCPACGCPSPVAVVTLPSGRRVRIEACAVCGRQDVRPVRGIAELPLA
jgi:predicted nucleic acid-binding Zn ribbon protein